MRRAVMQFASFLSRLPVRQTNEGETSMERVRMILLFVGLTSMMAISPLGAADANQRRPDPDFAGGGECT
jgi:hypothetical protein